MNWKQPSNLSGGLKGRQMNENQITQYIVEHFNGVRVVDAWGDTFFFYNPDGDAPDEFYFATLKSSDDEYDNQSNLNRPSIFRLNIGIGKERYSALFGKPPSRHAKTNGDTEEGDISNYDFTALDQLLPHPVYGRMHWVCVLNPSEETFEALKPLLEEAYTLAVKKYERQRTRKAAQGNS
jgi:hypothetical protein